MILNFFQINIFALILILLSSCMQEHNQRNELLYFYSSDTLKQEAVIFILDNLEDLTEETPNIVSKEEGQTKSIGELGVENLNYSNIGKTKQTKIHLDSKFIKDNIDFAFKVWNKYPWAKNVPKDVFFNYILAPQIYGEKIGNWRHGIYDKYKSYIDSLAIANYAEGNVPFEINQWFYYRLIVDSLQRSFRYNPSAIRFTRYQGYEELTAINEGECLGGSYLGTYCLRTFGVPATIDFVPVWGSRNSGHAIEMIWSDNKQKLEPPVGREIGINFPSKVFRYSYKKQNLTTEYLDFLQSEYSIYFEYLKHNHWIDVTSEHTNTIDFKYPTDGDSIGKGYLYICVYNYDEWLPVFWSKINKDGLAVFPKMGCNMLYRIALPTGNGKYKLISDIIKLDSIGKIVTSHKFTNKTTKLSLSKTNTGEKSYVKKNTDYTLFFWNNSDWILHQTILCMQDSVLECTNVPTGVYYKLREKNSTNKLERIFTYEPQLKKQIFY